MLQEISSNKHFKHNFIKFPNNTSTQFSIYFKNFTYCSKLIFRFSWNIILEVNFYY